MSSVQYSSRSLSSWQAYKPITHIKFSHISYYMAEEEIYVKMSELFKYNVKNFIKEAIENQCRSCVIEEKLIIAPADYKREDFKKRLEKDCPNKLHNLLHNVTGREEVKVMKKHAGYGTFEYVLQCGYKNIKVEI